jgi:Ras-related protein Rab-4B
MVEKKSYIFKILAVGVRSSGINSLISSFGAKAIVGTIQQSLGVDFFTKKVVIDENTVVYLQFWVMYQKAGFFFSAFLDRAQGLMFIFDVTNKTTFDPLSKWITDARKKLPDENIPIFIVGNKSDLPNREIQFEKAEDLCKSSGGTYVNYMSVKTGQNVEAMFAILAELVLSNHLQS